jgi:carbamoyltransferase
MSRSQYILGISAYYHDSAAALLKDGRIVAAAQEERFTRIKHDAAFPARAVEYCLAEAGIAAKDLAAVGFYEKPLVKFHRLLETYLAWAPAGFKSFQKAMTNWIGQKLHIPREIRKGIPGLPADVSILFTEHHESHQASAFFSSPFEEAAIITADGVGEWPSTSIGVGRGNKIEILQEINFPHSLGLLYSAFTYYTGFKVNSGEYKVMGLAPYGDPKAASEFAKLIREHLIDIKDDGSFRMNMEYFGYCEGLTMTNERFDKLFGGPPREAESQLTQREMDLALAVQMVTEEAMLKLARHARQLTGCKNLCMAGGVALNCVANGKMIQEGIFDKFFIQPAAGDAGGALGVAQFLHYQVLDNPRKVDGVHDLQRGSLLGPEYTDKEIRRYLDGVGAKYEAVDDPRTWEEKIAGILADGKVVGLFQGRMEFGPRALGARSIIGDARNRDMQTVMNLKIKFRESFRPFAPIVLQEHAHEYFDLKDPSPYMLRVGHVVPQRRVQTKAEDEKLFGIDKLKVQRSDIPAVTHVDYSARVQTVDANRNPRLHGLMKRFHERTGCAVLVNTSFNIRGEPIVCTPADAYKCFMFTDMDVLVLEGQILHKKDQPPMTGAEEYRAAFKLD